MGFFDKLKAACGIPDYEAYLKEHKEKYPNEEPLSKEEFLKREKERLNSNCAWG